MDKKVFLLSKSYYSETMVSNLTEKDLEEWIAEEDYKLRGPGDVHGTEQSGQNIYIEEILSYPDLFEKAKAAAEMCTAENRYGMMLRHMYEEHDRLDMIYRERKKG